MEWFITNMSQNQQRYGVSIKKNILLCIQANIALLVGDCTLTTLSRVNGAMEKLEFKKISADISIYYNQSMYAYIIL